MNDYEYINFENILTLIKLEKMYIISKYVNIIFFPPKVS